MSRRPGCLTGNSTGSSTRLCLLNTIDMVLQSLQVASKNESRALTLRRDTVLDVCKGALRYKRTWESFFLESLASTLSSSNRNDSDQTFIFTNYHNLFRVLLSQYRHPIFHVCLHHGPSEVQHPGRPSPPSHGTYFFQCQRHRPATRPDPEPRWYSNSSCKYHTSLLCLSEVQEEV